jgi:hypothetical protein
MRTFRHASDAVVRSGWSSDAGPRGHDRPPPPTRRIPASPRSMRKQNDRRTKYGAGVSVDPPSLSPPLRQSPASRSGPGGLGAPNKGGLVRPTYGAAVPYLRATASSRFPCCSATRWLGVSFSSRLRSAWQRDAQPPIENPREGSHDTQANVGDCSRGWSWSSTVSPRSLAAHPIIRPHLHALR